MKAVINISDPVAKVVGRRRSPGAPQSYGLKLQETLRQLSPPRYPRGVFKFHSHVEADAWLMDHLTRKQES